MRKLGSIDSVPGVEADSPGASRRGGGSIMSNSKVAPMRERSKAKFDPPHSDSNLNMRSSSFKSVNTSFKSLKGDGGPEVDRGSASKASRVCWSADLAMLITLLTLIIVCS